MAQVIVTANDLEAEAADAHRRIGDYDKEDSDTLKDSAGGSLREIDGEDVVATARCETVAPKAAKADGGLL